MAFAGLLAALVVGAMLTTSAGGAQKVRIDNLLATINGSVTPKKLSRKTPTPITLKLSGALETTDHSHPPPVKEVLLEFDRNGHLNTRGLPSCKVGQLQSTLTNQAKRLCRKALIGRGRATAEIAFPEQRPFSASGPLLIFNGSHGRRRILIIHVYAKVPAPTTFVTTAIIGKGRGLFGTTARVRVPTITAGQGSVTGFKSTIRRTLRVRGRRQSVLTATCKSGQLRARGYFLFAGGAKLSGQVTRSCTPKR